MMMGDYCELRALIEKALTLPDSIESVMIRGQFVFRQPTGAFFLVLPLSHAADALRGLKFFCSNKLCRLLARLAIALRPWQLDNPLLYRLPAAWERKFSVNLRGATFFCGSPGPYQKLTIFLPGASVETQSVIIKVSLKSTADDTLEWETTALKQLSNLSDKLSRRVPRLLEFGQLPSGRNFLATEAVQGYPVQCGFGEAQKLFLTQLARETQQLYPWNSGPVLERTRQRLSNTINRSISPLLGELYAKALDECVFSLPHEDIPAVLVHGDFAPWNMQFEEGELKVYDWEYTLFNANPLSDFLHFHLSQGKGCRFVFLWRSLLSKARDYAQQIFPFKIWDYAVIGKLALHHLLDTLLFYEESSKTQGLNLNSRLVKHHLALLKTRQLWL